MKVTKKLINENVEEVANIKLKHKPFYQAIKQNELAEKEAKKVIAERTPEKVEDVEAIKENDLNKNIKKVKPNMLPVVESVATRKELAQLLEKLEKQNIKPYITRSKVEGMRYDVKYTKQVLAEAKECKEEIITEEEPKEYCVCQDVEPYAYKHNPNLAIGVIKKNLSKEEAEAYVQELKNQYGENEKVSWSVCKYEDCKDRDFTESFDKKHLDESLKIIADIDDYRPWSGAIDTWGKIQEAGLVEELEFLLEDIYPDGLTMVELNDLLWFDGDWVLENLGLVEDSEEDDEIEEKDDFEEVTDKYESLKEGKEEDLNLIKSVIEKENKLYSPVFVEYTFEDVKYPAPGFIDSSNYEDLPEDVAARISKEEYENFIKLGLKAEKLAKNISEEEWDNFINGKPLKKAKVDAKPLKKAKELTKGSRQLEYEDDLVKLYKNGKEVYKGIFDYCFDDHDEFDNFKWTGNQYEATDSENNKWVLKVIDESLKEDLEDNDRFDLVSELYTAIVDIVKKFAWKGITLNDLEAAFEECIYHMRDDEEIPEDFFAEPLKEAKEEDLPAAKPEEEIEVSLDLEEPKEEDKDNLVKFTSSDTLQKAFDLTSDLESLLLTYKDQEVNEDIIELIKEILNKQNHINGMLSAISSKVDGGEQQELMQAGAEEAQEILTKDLANEDGFEDEDGKYYFGDKIDSEIDFKFDAADELDKIADKERVIDLNDLDDDDNLLAFSK